MGIGWDQDAGAGVARTGRPDVDLDATALQFTGTSCSTWRSTTTSRRATDRSSTSGTTRPAAARATTSRSSSTWRRCTGRSTRSCSWSAATRPLAVVGRERLLPAGRRRVRTRSWRGSRSPSRCTDTGAVLALLRRTPSGMDAERGRRGRADHGADAGAGEAEPLPVLAQPSSSRPRARRRTRACRRPRSRSCSWTISCLPAGRSVTLAEADVRAQPAVDRHRGGETDLLEAVVEPRARASRALKTCWPKRGQQADSVRKPWAMVSPNGPARRALHVDVDPLVVVGRVGERGDAVLVDGEPVAGAEVASPPAAATSSRVVKVRMASSVLGLLRRHQSAA